MIVVVTVFGCFFFFFDGSMSLIMLLLKRFDNDWRLSDVSRNVVVEILRLILIGLGLIVSTKVK